MKKVLIITPCGLPIPAVKGGAVLTLIESIIKQNEIYKNMDLSVIGIYNNEALEKSKVYNSTKFIYLKKNIVIKKIDNFISKLITIIKDKGINKKEYSYIWKLKVIRKIRKHLKYNDYDKIIIQNAGYILKVFRNKKVMKKYKGKLYYHLHNDVPRNCDKNVINKCKFILISNYLRKELIKRYGIEKNINILHNGFDCNMFQQELSDIEKKGLRKNLNIMDDDKVIIFTGRISEIKGILQLTKAFSKIKQENVKLLIIGSSSFGEKYVTKFELNMIEEFKNLGNRIIFTGYVPYLDIWKYYKIADIAVLPSVWQEPMGLTIVEAMSSGLPVISTVSGGIPEFLNEKYGILLKLDENLVDNLALNIKDMLANLEYWKNRGDEASQYIQNIVSEKRFYNDFCNILEQS